jgi:predicted acylesterase/phospholipase RssA
VRPSLRQVLRTPFPPRKGWLAAGLLAVAGFTAPLGAQSRACTPGRTALVLSGGGARGVAHLGVIAALDSLGIRPDYVVGTSMGAIVGALYAAGGVAGGTDSLSAAFSSAALFSSSTPSTPQAWEPFTPLLIWGGTARGFTLQSPTVDEARANALLSALLLRPNLLAQGDFDRLSIPFRAVATDLVTRDAVVLSSGDLAQAVRASMSVPVLFSPEQINGRLLVDGGLSANVPVAVARALPGVTRVIVSDVTSSLLTEQELEAGPLAVADQLAGFLFVQPADSLGPDDVYIRPDLKRVKNLDFAPAAVDSIRRLGRVAADSALTRGGCLPTGPITPGPLPGQVAQFALTGGLPTDAPLLERFLGVAPGDSIDLASLARQVREVSELGTFTALWLHPGPASRGRVAFQATVQPAPSKLAGATAAYDRDLGARAGMMYLDRHLFGHAYEGSATLGLGTLLNDLTLGLRRYFGAGHTWVAPTLTAHLEHLDITLYDTDGQDVGHTATQEGVAFAGAEQGIAGGWILAAGLDGRLWQEGDTTAASGSETTNGSSLGARFAVGRRRGAWKADGQVIWSSDYQRVSLATSYELGFGLLALTPAVRLGWGDGLPLQDQFPLGGSGGFPGLAVEQLRGSREVYAGLGASHPVRGQLRWEVLVATGRSADGGALFANSDWLGGVRAGLALATPVGDIQAAYGVTTTGIDNVFVRLGRWF